MSCIFLHTYEDIISVENLLGAWKEFLKGKRNKQDVQMFQYHLFDNVLALHIDLERKTYTHGGYHAFSINDPKPRNIHKAAVRDRLLHHALYRRLYPFFDRTFIADSYSCRNGKGTHRALCRFRSFAWKVSKNHTRTCWALKCDIKKFFASVEHATLLDIISKRVKDKRVIWLVERILESFHTTRSGVGLPLGNLTSQLLANVYLNEFDKYVKHSLKIKYYIRYADDFVLLSHDRQYLASTLPYMEVFLREKLKLQLHPDKIFIKTFASGVDFLGWVHFPDHRVLRRSTKNRMLKRIVLVDNEAVAASYRGMLSHGNTYKIHELITANLKNLKERI